MKTVLFLQEYPIPGPGTNTLGLEGAQFGLSALRLLQVRNADFVEQSQLKGRCSKTLALPVCQIETYGGAGVKYPGLVAPKPWRRQRARGTKLKLLFSKCLDGAGPSYAKASEDRG